MRFADEIRGGPFAALFPLRPLERLLFGGFTFEERWRLLLLDAGFEEGGSDSVIVLNPLSIPERELAGEIRENGDRARAWTKGGRILAAVIEA
ncbi:MAG: hypothetical protein ABIH26_09310, partial [Candidatus Eisenbacteria bacterium]